MDLNDDIMIEIGNKRAYIFKRIKQPVNLNFHDLVYSGFDNVLIIENGWDNSFIQLVNNDLKAVSIISDTECIDISFLEENFINIFQLFVNCKSISGIEVVSKLNSLEYFSLICKKNQNLNIVLPSSLKYLVLNWKSKYNLLQFPITLESVVLEDMELLNWESKLNNLSNLKKIDLTKCKVQQPDILFKLPKLKYLSLDTSEINFLNIPECESLKYLNLNKIMFPDIEFISNFKELDILIIENCNDFESILPIFKLKNIRGIFISGKTNIRNGDFNVLLKLNRLKNCFINDKSHYSIKTKINWNWNNFNDESNISTFDLFTLKR